MTYKIVRFYRDDKMSEQRVNKWGKHLSESFGLTSGYYNGMTIKEGLTLEEAREHCNDPETSSRTCEDGSHEEEHGPWFDGYREE